MQESNTIQSRQHTFSVKQKKQAREKIPPRVFLISTKTTYPPLKLTANRPCPKSCKLSSSNHPSFRGELASFPGRVMSGNLGIGCQPSWSSPLLERFSKPLVTLEVFWGKVVFGRIVACYLMNKGSKKYTLKRHPFFESMKNLIESEFQSVYNMKSKHLFSVSTNHCNTNVTWCLPPSGARRRASTRQQGSLPVCCVKTGKWSANVWLAYTDTHDIHIQ